MEPEPCIVTEYVRKGSLARLLHASDVSTTLASVLDVARGVAAALVYLHTRQPPVVHRDLTSSNVLIDVDPETFGWVAKVADFGLSRTRDGTTARRSAGTATAHAASPELLAGTYDTPTDVWSFGVLLFELATRRVPFAGRHPFEVILAIHGGLTPAGDLPAADHVPGESRALGHFVTAGLRSLMLACWALAPEDRPTAAELVARLDAEREGVGSGTAAAPAEPPPPCPLDLRASLPPLQALIPGGSAFSSHAPIEALEQRLRATRMACVNVGLALRARIDALPIRMDASRGSAPPVFAEATLLTQKSKSK